MKKPTNSKKNLGLKEAALAFVFALVIVAIQCGIIIAVLTARTT